jgi:hypothetical protein
LRETIEDFTIRKLIGTFSSQICGTAVYSPDEPLVRNEQHRIAGRPDTGDPAKVSLASPLHGTTERLRIFMGNSLWGCSLRGLHLSEMSGTLLFRVPHTEVAERQAGTSEHGGIPILKLQSAVDLCVL